MVSGLGRLRPLVALAGAFGLLAPAAAAASTQTFSTSQDPVNAGSSNMGWWSDTRANSDSNASYAAGWSRDAETLQDHRLRNYFTFHLTGLCGQVRGARLEITRAGHQGSGTATYALFDVATSAAMLNDKDAGPSVAIFDDLGSGTAYGSFEVSVGGGTPEDVLTFPLNAAGVEAVRAAAGGFLSIGGALADPPDGYVSGVGATSLFDGSGAAASVQNLVVECLDPPGVVTPPSVPGSARAGEVVTCDPGTWTGEPRFAFAWRRDGGAIPGATSASYAVRREDVGHALVCRVVATNDAGSSSADSNVMKVPLPPIIGEVAAALTRAQRRALLRETVVLPRRRPCARPRRFPVTLRAPRSVELRLAIVRLPRRDVRLEAVARGWDLKVGGRVVRRLRGGSRRASVVVRGLPRARLRARVILILADGRIVKSRRRYRGCPRKLGRAPG